MAGAIRRAQVFEFGGERDRVDAARRNAGPVLAHLGQHWKGMAVPQHWEVSGGVVRTNRAKGIAVWWRSTTERIYSARRIRDVQIAMHGCL